MLNSKYQEKLEEGGQAVGISEAEAAVERLKELSMEKSPDEDILAHRKESSSSHLKEKTYTNPLFVKLEDDGSGIFKTMDFRNERAAYLVDRFLGLGMVPPTVIRKVGDQEGSMQRFIEDAKTFYESPELDKSKENGLDPELREDFMKMWILDLMIRNFDRHGGNFLLKDKKMYAIDNGMGFDDFHNPRLEPHAGRHYGFRSFYGEKFPENILKKLKNFLEWQDGMPILRDMISELLGDVVADKFMERAKYILNLIAEKGMIDVEDLSR